MFALGAFDPAVPDAVRNAYLQQLQQLTRVPLANVVPGVDRLAFTPYAPTADQPMTVKEVQAALKRLGFLPGGAVDGICGYRTQSAIRLFQEYVRSVEGLDCLPDGRFGPATERHLQRWLTQGVTMTWSAAIDAWKGGHAGGEYAAWLALLRQVQAQRQSATGVATRLVDAWRQPTDTRRVANWDLAPTRVHLVGIRRREMSGKFDDIFVLLLKGLVFKFQGSTEPGASDNPLGRPFLVPGQHDYHFGWHQKKYLALRPNGPGVLVVRSRAGGLPTDADWGRGLEANATINIHWGGKGLTADVKNWSEGCQVINGSLYLDANDRLVNCTSFAAVNNGEVNNTPTKTRGAYNVLLDLVTALGSDLEPTVKYVLLEEGEMVLAPALAEGLARARGAVG